MRGGDGGGGAERGGAASHSRYSTTFSAVAKEAAWPMMLWPRVLSNESSRSERHRMPTRCSFGAPP